MAERNSKTIFTGDELKRIISLVRELEAADTSKQKGIRAKIRRIGLYWSEVAHNVEYTVANLQRLFENGTLKLMEQEEIDVKPSTPTKEMVEQQTPKPLRHIKISTDKEISQYMADGFDGFIRVAELRNSKFLLPEEAGVYVVLRSSQSQPQFLEKGTGGFFKGENSNVSIAELRANYVENTKTLYIGKATSLRKRVGQLLRFGEGGAVGHRGGRYLWQLADSANLMIAWKPTPDCDPRIVEAQMIQDFISLHGKRPFANLKD